MISPCNSSSVMFNPIAFETAKIRSSDNALRLSTWELRNSSGVLESTKNSPWDYSFQCIFRTSLNESLGLFQVYAAGFPFHVEPPSKVQTHLAPFQAQLSQFWISHSPFPPAGQLCPLGKLSHGKQVPIFASDWQQSWFSSILQALESPPGGTQNGGWGFRCARLKEPTFVKITERTICIRMCMSEFSVVPRMCFQLALSRPARSL